MRLLITNGGLLSIYEAIYFKKPIIGMPLFGDQFHNLALVEQHGIGRVISVDNITMDSFTEILTDVRTNPIYQENINRMHELMFELDPARDKLGQSVANIEYVIATKGARHLKSPALALSVWQLYLVDVVLTLILIMFLILAVPAIVIGVILRRANARIIKYDEHPAGQQMAGTRSKDDANNGSKCSVPTTPSPSTSSQATTPTSATLKKHN